MKKQIIVVASAVLALLFGFSESARAQTAAATTIGNTAVVSGGNFSVANSTVNVTVATQLGGRAISEIDAGSATGVIVTNTVSVTNKGNISTTFKFRYVLGQNGMNMSNWTAGFGAGFGANVTTGSLAPGASASVEFRVRTPVVESNNAYRSYAIIASNEASATTAIVTNYTGDNGVAYGGDIGDFGAGLRGVSAGGATGGTASNASVPITANRTWQVTISAAVVAVTKTAVVSGPAGTLPVPGATVTYRISITNTGSSGATGVEVRDNVPGNTSIVTGSLRGSAGTATAYAGATARTTPGGDDEGAANASFVEFSPNSTSADTTAGNGSTGTLSTAGATGGRAYFFRVTIN